MLKIFVSLFLFTVTAAYYQDLNENFDIDGLMKNNVKLKSFVDCYLDKEPCSDEAANYRPHIVDMFSNSCQNCDDKIKHFVEEFILNVMTNYPDDMAQLRAKYDPDGISFGKLALEVSKF